MNLYEQTQLKQNKLSEALPPQFGSKVESSSREMGSAASVFKTRRDTQAVGAGVCPHSQAMDRISGNQSTSPNHWVSQRAPTTPWVYSRIMAYNAEEWAARFGDVAPELATTVPTDPH